MFTNKDIMELRKKTGVGVLDCKKALTESEGDIEKAVVILRKKGMASLEKRAGKIACQGLVESYIHMNGSIGVLLEVNCETDFVAKSAQFKEFVKDVALQITASNPKYVSRTDIPQSFIDQEVNIATDQANSSGRKMPEKVVEQIVKGKVDKILQSITLLEQPFIKDGSKTVEDLLNEIGAQIGEKIVIRRFVRYEMGEGLEKKETEDLEAAVAEQIENLKK